MLNVLIAPNAFKGSLTATQVCSAIKQGLQESALECSCETFPIADGGDGTDELLGNLGGAKAHHVHTINAVGKGTNATYWMAGNEAFINVSSASGLRSLSRRELRPLEASSIGTGQLILHALDHGARKIIVGLGGSATVDAGCGILSALGAAFRDRKGYLLDPLPINLHRLYEIDLSSVDARIFSVELIALADVRNTLLGERGAARVFAPQKGASASQVEHLESALEHFVSVANNVSSRPLHLIDGGGAAGGIGAMMSGMLDATLMNGAEFLLSRFDFDARLRNADLLITGEGAIDEQTLDGKAPFAVARRALEYKVPCIAMAGNVPDQKSPALAKYFPVLQSICNKPSTLAGAMRMTKLNVRRASCELGNALALGMNFN